MFLCEKRCAASLQARPGGIRDSLRREASQAAGAAPTLRYGPAGDTAPATLKTPLLASEMAPCDFQETNSFYF